MRLLRYALVFLVPLFLILTAAPGDAAEPRVVKGRVIMDTNGNGRVDAGEQGMPNIAISDGVQFVTTDEEGNYELTVADDPLFPYKPAQVIAMSWPSGTWPSSLWYRRLADLPAGEALNFSLRPDEQQLPFTLAHGTDPHDNCGGAKSRMWGEEIRRMGSSVDFAVMTGDLGYAYPHTALEMFTSIASYTQKFPVPLFHTIGNHDVVGIHSADWKKQTEMDGNGAYTKFLGPIRWSFNYAGVHIVGIDWAVIDEKKGTLELGVPDVATNWLKQEFARQEPGTRTFLFIHSQWSPTPPFWDLLAEKQPELMLAGHSHRNLDVSFRGVTALTTMNLRGPYRLLTIEKEGYDIIDRCMGCKDPTYHSRDCRLRSIEMNTSARRQEHWQPGEVAIASAERPMANIQGAGVEFTARIEPAGAKRSGIKITAVNNAAETLEIACVGDALFVDGLEIPAVPMEGESHFDLKVVVDNNRLAITSNLRVAYEKPLKWSGPLRGSLFAEDGKTVFKDVEAWSLK